MPALNQHSIWKAQNLAAIHERLELLRATDELEQVIPGALQGVFIRKIEQTLEMYCYDNYTQQLSSIMSRINLDKPLHLLGDYTQTMLLSAVWQEEPPTNIYMAGFGGGRLAMLFNHYFEDVRVDGSDIDSNVIAASQVYFGLDKNLLNGIAVADSRKDLHAREIEYDIILLDVFTGGGEHVSHLATVEFFDLCKARMTPKAVMVANLISMDPLMKQKIVAIQSAFQHCHVWEFNGAHVIFASNSPLNNEDFQNRVAKFQRDESLSFDLMEKAQMLKPQKYEDEVRPLLDDNL